MTLTIKSIQVLLADEADTVIFTTDLPSAMSGRSQGYLEMKAAPGSGVAYVARHFPGIPVEVIEVVCR